MKVILMTDVPALGQRGETRDVANGYARNFLLPRKLAVPATPANLKNVEHLKRQRAREEQRALETAKATAERIEGLTLAVTARASEDGRLYGSVSPQDVVEFLERHKISVEKRRVAMDEPIKAVGDYKVPVRLHGDVTAALTVTVKARVARPRAVASAWPPRSRSPARSRRRASRRSGRCSAPSCSSRPCCRGPSSS